MEFLKMKMGSICLIIAALALTSVLGLKKVCYYEGWAQYRQSPNDLRPEALDTHLCTHLLYAFSNITHDGSNLEAASADDEALYPAFTGLKSKNPNLKTMLSVGGWEMGSEPFMKVVATNHTMQVFARNVVTYLRAHNFDGVDVDWEYPADRGSEPEDKEKFAILLQKLHFAFTHEPNRGSNDRLLLSVAVATADERVRESYDVAQISRYADFINLMLYDFHGEWDGIVNVHSAMYSDSDINVDHSVKLWISEGAARDKLIVGMPLYGRQFVLADSSQHSIGDLITDGGDIPYYTICKLIADKNLKEHILPTERVPYIIYDNQWVGYDNVASLTEKAQYVLKNGLGGAMVWAITLDDTTGACGQGTYPLMRAILHGMSGAIVIGK